MSHLVYRIVHSTTYTYEQPARACHNSVTLLPRSDGPTTPVNFRVQIRPQPESIWRREDFFGNSVHSFSLDASHRQLIVTASGRVRVAYPAAPDPQATPSWSQVRTEVQNQQDPNWFESCQYQFESPRIRMRPEFADYCAASFTAGRPVLASALELTHRIAADFEYDVHATEVHTPTDRAFSMRRGVCQDFAHVQIACLRSLGVPARYVSGYLRTVSQPGQPALLGADQSHAWVSVYCGRQVGWIDLDPTNNKICDNDHIPIAWGRDFGDVIPVRGVFLGGGEHAISVSVDVQPIED